MLSQDITPNSKNYTARQSDSVHLGAEERFEMVVPYLNADMFFLPLSQMFSTSHPQRQDFDLSAGLMSSEKAAHTFLQHFWFLALSLACSVVSVFPLLVSYFFLRSFSLASNLAKYCILCFSLE